MKTRFFLNFCWISKKIFEWKDQLEKNELLVRDIIDIDSTYEDFENDNSEDENLKKVAKEGNLAAIEADGRIGFSKFAKANGFKETYRHFEMEF